MVTRWFLTKEESSAIARIMTELALQDRGDDINRVAWLVNNVNLLRGMVADKTIDVPNKEVYCEF